MCIRDSSSHVSSQLQNLRKYFALQEDILVLYIDCFIFQNITKLSMKLREIWKTDDAIVNQIDLCELMQITRKYFFQVFLFFFPNFSSDVLDLKVLKIYVHQYQHQRYTHMAFPALKKLNRK